MKFLNNDIRKNLEEVNQIKDRGFELHSSVGSVYLEKMHAAKVMELIVSGIDGWELKYVENAPNHVFTARVQAERVYYVQLKDLAL